MPSRDEKSEREKKQEGSAEDRGRSAARTKDAPAHTVQRQFPPRGGAQRSRRLEDRTVAELRERAKQLEISGRSKMNKEELVSAIRRKNG